VHREISNDALYALHRQVRLFLSPLRAGAGVKGKLNMALWLGLPIVASSMAAEGMGLVDGESMLLASTPEEFADATSRLYGDYELWSRLRRGGYAINEKYYSRQIATRVLNETVAYLGLTGRSLDEPSCRLGEFSSDRQVMVDENAVNCLHPSILRGFPAVEQYESNALGTSLSSEFKPVSNTVKRRKRFYGLSCVRKGSFLDCRSNKQAAS
jgi:hypothetical protein